MSQCTDILRHLQQRGTITPMEALAEYGCFRLAARIEDLRKAGHPIYTKDIHANGKTFAEYRMDQLVLL